MSLIQKLAAAGQEASRRAATVAVKLEGDAFLVVRKTIVDGAASFATSRVPIAAMEGEGNPLLDELLRGEAPPAAASPPATPSPAPQPPPPARPEPAAIPEGASAAAAEIERAQVLFRRAAAAGLNDAERERLQAEGLAEQARAIEALRAAVTA